MITTGNNNFIYLFLTGFMLALAYQPVQSQQTKADLAEADMEFPVTINVSDDDSNRVNIDFKNLPQGISYRHSGKELTITWTNRPNKQYYEKFNLTSVYRNVDQGIYKVAVFEPGKVTFELNQGASSPRVKLTDDGIRIDFMQQKPPFITETITGDEENIIIKTRRGFTTNMEFKDKIKKITAGSFSFQQIEQGTQQRQSGGNFAMVVDNTNLDKTVLTVMPQRVDAHTNLTIYTEHKVYTIYIKSTDEGKFHHRVKFPPATKTEILSPTVHRAQLLIREYMRLKDVRQPKTPITGKVSVQNLERKQILKTDYINVYTDYLLRYRGWLLQGFVFRNKTESSVRINPRKWGSHVVATSPRVVLPDQVGTILTIRPATVLKRQIGGQE